MKALKEFVALWTFVAALIGVIYCVTEIAKTVHLPHLVTITIGR